MNNIPVPLEDTSEIISLLYSTFIKVVESFINVFVASLSLGVLQVSLGSSSIESKSVAIVSFYYKIILVAQ